MINILVIGISDIYGGIESYMNNVVENISKKNYHFDFINLSANKLAFEDNFIKNGAKIFNVTGRKRNFWKYRKEIIKILKKSKYDFIHIHIMSYEAFERILWSLKYSNAKVIVHSHNAGFGKNAKLHTRILHYLGKFLLSNKNFYKVACGADAGKWMYDDEKFEILNNGIEFEKYKFDAKNRQKIRKMYNIFSDEIVIGHTGRLENQKNHDFLIDLFYEFHKENSNSKLMLVGDGSLREKLEKKVNELSLVDDVIFTGRVDNVNEYYSSFDLFILPSLFEGLSISLIEAQFNGLKCFCSDTIDKTSDISGNIFFISLKTTKRKWIDEIKKNGHDRDFEILNDINHNFFIENSIQKLESYYIEKR